MKRGTSMQLNNLTSAMYALLKSRAVEGMNNLNRAKFALANKKEEVHVVLGSGGAGGKHFDELLRVYAADFYNNNS